QLPMAARPRLLFEGVAANVCQDGVELHFGHVHRSPGLGFLLLHAGCGVVGYRILEKTCGRPSYQKRNVVSKAVASFRLHRSPALSVPRSPFSPAAAAAPPAASLSSFSSRTGGGTSWWCRRALGGPGSRGGRRCGPIPSP